MNRGDWVHIGILFGIVLILIMLVYLLITRQYVWFLAALIACIALYYGISRRIKL